MVVRLPGRLIKMARLRRFSTTHQGSKRAFTWFGGISNVFGVSVLAVGASNLFTSIDTRVVAFPAPWTIVRVRGILMVASDQVASSEFAHGAFGIAVVNGEAFDVGLASIPTPFSEFSDDRWLYHTYWAAPIQVIAGQGVTGGHQVITIDGKAMRKVKLGDEVVLVIENGHNSQGAFFMMNVRIGIKLH